MQELDINTIDYISGGGYGDNFNQCMATNLTGSGLARSFAFGAIGGAVGGFALGGPIGAAIVGFSAGGISVGRSALRTMERCAIMQ
ncbi:hypothetical protein [Chromobacterium sp. IIBBL 290-4]|uniref:hypothetical protein n=1 Tax=Chromobacterium sp. IIBBL 290-4 TaxID=2953890 RepID=UPI0020B81044|nr:hypothetical protein [Chromobacterium sp. IIBBL 290-4]UTH74196.1 hypothetical protein NKT35_22090 [Chromobacterium sp. IIBBL 290-4]